MIGSAWSLTRQSVLAFLEDGALSRGAAIAFYAITALGPVLLILVSVVGLVYGEAAARGALIGRLSGVMGPQSAGFLQTAIGSAWHRGTGFFATIIGVVSLLLTASGMFGEMQAALNAIWRASPRNTSILTLLRNRLLSLLLVLCLALVLILSAVLSTVITALQDYLDAGTPLAGPMFQAVNVVVSLVILTAMVATVYRVLPDRELSWRDVMVGALVTAVLITIGKQLIGLYIGRSGIASAYGAAGSFLAVLLWIYYSAQIFLFGAEFTRVYAERGGEFSRSPAGSTPPIDRASAASSPPSQAAS